LYLCSPFSAHFWVRQMSKKLKRNWRDSPLRLQRPPSTERNVLVCVSTD
jgi:hypothetical protein